MSNLQLSLSQTAINRQIKRFMTSEHLNQTQLGARIGLQQTNVSARLRGKTRWTLDDLDKLAAMGVPITLHIPYAAPLKEATQA